MKKKRYNLWIWSTKRNSWTVQNNYPSSESADYCGRILALNGIKYSVTINGSQEDKHIANHLFEKNIPES